MRTVQHLEVVRRDPLRQASLDPNDRVAIARDGRFRSIDVGERQIVRVTAWQDARAADVDQDPSRLWRRARDCHHIVDSVRTCRTRVYPSRHAVGQADVRAVVVTRVVAMDIEEPRHDDLACRIDHLVGAGVDIRGDRRNAAPSNRDVPDRVDVQ